MVMQENNSFIHASRSKKETGTFGTRYQFFFQIALRVRGNSDPVGGQSEILLGGFFY